jgi:hypothetical protein
LGSGIKLWKSIANQILRSYSFLIKCIVTWIKISNWLLID